MAFYPREFSAAEGNATLRRRVATLSLVLAFAASGTLACEGDLEGAWERRPANTAADFEPVEEFRLDSRTGQLEDCTRDIRFDARLIREGRTLTFLYRAQSHRLHPVTPGVYLSSPTSRNVDGQQWEYRYRLVER